MMRLKPSRPGRRGVSALEFALSAPIALFIMFAVADLGDALQQKIRLEGAVRAAAQVAFSRPADAAAIRDAAMANLAGWSLTTQGGDVTFASQSWCQCSDVPIGHGNAVDCNGDNGTCDLAQVVSVMASRPYTPLLIVPVRTLTADVELRLR